MKKFIHFLCALLLVTCMFSVVKKQTINVHADNGIPMYRLYNPYSGEHLYTKNKQENDNIIKIGWIAEGIGWYSPETSNTPVYRLYNPNSSDHHYTMNKEENDWLVKLGWVAEGIGWYSDDNKTVPVYRQFNPNVSIGTHNYTTSKNENDWLASLGWVPEGTCWYATAGSDSPEIPQTDVKKVVKPVTPPFYSQIDNRWAGMVYGRYDMRTTACGVCTMAMIISARTGKSVLPPEVADYLYSVGLYNGSIPGTNGASFLTAGKKYGLLGEGIGSYDALVDVLRQGKLVAMQVVGEPFVNPGASHAMVIYGYENGTVNVLDPLGGKCNGKYSAADIWNHRSDVSTDLDQGVPGFAF
jgi:hypothetical protein